MLVLCSGPPSAADSQAGARQTFRMLCRIFTHIPTPSPSPLLPPHVPHTLPGGNHYFASTHISRIFRALPPCLQVLVLDTCMGVVTAAVVERLGGLGSVCNTYTDRPVTMDASKSLNLAPAQARTWCSAALHMLHEVKVRVG